MRNLEGNLACLILTFEEDQKEQTKEEFLFSLAIVE